MAVNRKVIVSSGMLALLVGTLEEAHAKQNPKTSQVSVENKASLNSSKEPVSEVNQWQKLPEQRSKPSTAVNVQANGLSSLDAIKQQTKSFSSSLRAKGQSAEGRVEAPGLFEFSTYFSEGINGSSSDDNAEKLRIATIAGIEKVLKQGATQAQRVDLLLRLAELHAERHIYFLRKEMDTYEKAYEKWQKNMNLGQEPKFIQQQSLQSLNTATQILRNLVNQYPNHPKAADALYQLGFLLTEMKSESALLYFQRLIERFPKSRFIPDAHLALGEFHFSRNKFSEALPHYQKALQDRESRSYPYAVYKLGWTFFNLRGSDEETQKNLQKSLVAFKLLVKLSQESGKEKKLGLLKKDALRDMVMVYAEMGEIEEAQSFFKSIHQPELYTTLLERLAWLNAEGGRYREATEIYNRLLSEFPLHPKNPVFLMRLAGLHDKDQRREQMIESLATACALLANDSQWSAAQKVEQNKKDAKEALLKELNLWAIRLHAEFQKTKDKKTAQNSLQLYELSLKQREDSADQFLIHFNRAQLLTSIGEHDRAVDGYLRVAVLDKKLNLGRKETKIGLENAIAESEILIGSTKAPAERSSPLSPVESRLIQVIDLHAGLYPKDSEKLAHQHRAAFILFQAKQIPQAFQRWTTMAKENPSSPYVSEGLRLLIKHSFDASDWVKAGQDTKHFLALPGIAAQPVGGQLSKLHRVAQFQYGLVLEKKGRHSDAAQLFLSFQKAFPQDPDAPKALINAANNQFKASRADSALSTLELFVRLYPSSEYRGRALEMMAATAEGMSRFAEAAAALEQLSERTAQREQAAQTQLRAAELRMAAGHFPQAIANAQNSLSSLKTSGEICEAYKTLFDAQSQIAQSKTLETAKAATQRCQTASPEWGIYFAGIAARLSLSQKDKGEANRLASLALSRGKVLHGKLQSPYAFEGLRIAGSVQLELLEEQSRTLSQRRILNSNNIQNEFTIIKGTAQNLAQQFVQLAQAGQPETSVGALYRVAEIQETLAQILLRAPDPVGGTASENETFRARIEKIAIPLQEEAAQLYAQALEKSHEAETLTPYTNLLQEKISSIRPGESRKPIEIMTKPGYMSHEIPITEQTKGVLQTE